MTTYIVWFKLGNYRTTETQIQASDLGAAQLIAESMYGKENVINVRTA
jgi:hypothetical protein